MVSESNQLMVDGLGQPDFFKAEGSCPGGEEMPNLHQPFSSHVIRLLQFVQQEGEHVQRFVPEKLWVIRVGPILVLKRHEIPAKDYGFVSPLIPVFKVGLYASFCDVVALITQQHCGLEDPRRT